MNKIFFFLSDAKKHPKNNVVTNLTQHENRKRYEGGIILTLPTPDVSVEHPTDRCQAV